MTAGRKKTQIVIHNWYDFLDLSHLQGFWSVEVNGTSIAKGKLPKLTTVAGGKEIIDLPLTLPRLKTGEEAFISCWFTQRSQTTWSAKGHEVARDQITLGGSPGALVDVVGGSIVKEGAIYR